MHIIGFIIGGFVVGLFGRLIVPGRQPLGCLWTTTAGIFGSVVAGLIGRQIWGKGYAPGFITSVLGAAIVVALLSRILDRGRSV
ncbi:MAG: GlsB/YeaQ/YmgE family stress response membrane protein [Actinomycetota bacterium]